jgi:hypothetical protein
MMGIKLNAQVIIKNDFESMHEKSLPPTGASGTGARMRMELAGVSDWARLQRRGPHTGGRSHRLPVVGVADVPVIESRDGHWQ